MSSVLSSQGAVLATAMAVSGTVILLAFRLQKSSSQQVLRSCISSEGKKRKKKKRVHFAEDVVDPRGDSKEFRRQHSNAIVVGKNSSSSSPKFNNIISGDGAKEKGMPANRVALYNGILRDRVIQRLAYSY